MRAEGVAAAFREYRRLSRAHTRLEDATDWLEADDAWADFLTHANRIYTKLRAACYGHPLDWAWWKKKLDERRDWPILSYVHRARNCDTHRLEMTLQYVADGKEGAPRIKAFPVIDKGVTYLPPTEDLDLLADVASQYLQELLLEANSRLR